MSAFETARQMYLDAGEEEQVFTDRYAWYRDNGYVVFLAGTFLMAKLTEELGRRTWFVECFVGKLAHMFVLLSIAPADRISYCRFNKKRRSLRRYNRDFRHFAQLASNNERL